MIDLAPPPTLAFPRPAIIRSAEPWELALHRRLAARGVPRRVRLAIAAEFKRMFGADQKLIRATANDLARFAGDASLASFLPGMFPAGAVRAAAGGVVKTKTHLGGQLSDSNLTTYDFTYNLGAESADRRIVVGAASGNGNRTLSSVVINGVTATIIDQVTGGSQVPVGLAIALVPTGTTGVTISVTWSAGQLHTMIDAWALTGLTTDTPVDFGNSVANPQSVALDSVADGFAIAMSVYRAGSLPAPTWGGGVTVDYSGESAEATAASGASGATASTTITPTCAWSTDTRRAMVAATF